MKKIQLKPGRYSLVREEDGRGDSGGMLTPFDWRLGRVPEEYGTAEECNGVIEVGYGVKCGAIIPRTFSTDWWLTTKVAEIDFIQYNKDNEAIEVRFVTESGRKYVAKSS